MIRALIKIPAFLFLMLLFIVVSIFIDLIIRNKEKKLRCFSSITSLTARAYLKILGIRVKRNGYPGSITSPCLIVSNHLSYIDILILSSATPSLFITSVEVQKTFFLGFISRLAGSLFVERRNKSRLREEIDRITDCLKKGFVITLFPEGTSSNGETIYPFKGALFSASRNSGIDFLPVCIKYNSINGKPISAVNRDLAYYYGDIQFFPHLMKLFFVKSIDVTVTYLEWVKTAGEDRKEVVESCHSAISSVYHKN